MKTPPERLKDFIENYYRSTTDFCKAMDVGRGALNNYINADLVFSTKKTLDRLAKTGIAIEYYLHGTGDKVDESNLKNNKYYLKEDVLVETKSEKKVNGEEIYRIPKEFQGMLANIRLHIMNVSAATCALTDLNDLPTTFMPLALGMNIDQDTHDAIYVNGESMEDAGISTGDIIIFEKQNFIPDYDCLIVGSLNGMPIMKHLFHNKDGSIQLKSDSQKHKDIFLGDLEDLILFGIVKKVIKDHAPNRKKN